MLLVDPKFMGNFCTEIHWRKEQDFENDLIFLSTQVGERDECVLTEGLPDSNDELRVKGFTASF